MDNNTSGRPPMTPVVAGLIAIGYAVLFGLSYCVYAVATYQNPPEPSPPLARVIPALLGLMGAFSVMLLPAGVGVMLHRQWGKSLMHSMMLGLIVCSGLGSTLTFTGMGTGYSEGVMMLLPVGLITGAVAAVALALLFRSSAMDSIFPINTNQENSKS